ncbi:COG5281 Phage-related minor tail protein [uncultured Caudovirales phage]|uniref:COG5281 Phage-related minor tail protein n=1 Tax=uncultured Caudovirales phage TaxID=2100421 RepID=A0A6J5N0V0_9CAUD|nr:COG5281 Phage-related minor tail protein [uncultured Caudovirales phage]
MASQNIARLGVVLGLDTAEFSAGIDKAISENKKLKTQIQRESNAAAKEIVALKYATEDYNKSLTKTEQIQREITSGKFANAAQELKNKLLEQAKAYDAVAASAAKAQAVQGGLGTNAATAGGLNAQQKAALGYQTTDIITGLAGGQNPMLVLIQQGGQLRDQFGGFVPLFRAITSVITPMNVAIVAAGAAIIGTAYAVYQAKEALKDFNNTIALTGNYANLTYDQFKQVSVELGKFAEISTGSANDIYKALVASGQFTSKAIGSVAKAIAEVSRLSGVQAKDVAQQLISSFDGSASSAAKLNAQYHFLTAAQYNQIEVLEKTGKTQEAIKLTADLLTKSLEGQAEKLGFAEKAWLNFKNAIASALSLFDEKTIKQKVEDIEKTIAKLSEQIAARSKMQGGTPAVQAAIEQGTAVLKAELAKQLAAREKLWAEEAQKEYEATKKSEDAAKNATEIKSRIAAGGYEKEQALVAQNEKIKNDIAFQSAVYGAGEVERIEKESLKKLSDAYAEYIAANKKELGVFNALRLEQYKLTLLQISQWETQSKQAISDREYKTVKDRQIASRDELDSQIERINLYKENIFISEQDLNLQLAKLKTQQEIEKINRIAGLSDRQRAELIKNETELLNKRLLVAGSEANRSEVLRLKQRQISDEESLKVEEEKLRIYEKNLLISDADYRIEVSRLETAKKIAEIRQNEKIGDPGAREQLAQREEMLQKQREGIIQLSERLNVLRDVNRAVFQDMENAIVNFVKTGKLNFKSLAQSIISDIMAIYVKAQFLQMFKGAGNMFSSLFGGGGSPAGMIGDFPSIPMAASGGYIDGPTLVGENGPEIFMPRNAGTVIPNQRLNDFQSAPQVVYNGPYIAQMNAIDTQSATQFLARNKQAVWAANQSASRGVPASRA